MRHGGEAPAEEEWATTHRLDPLDTTSLLQRCAHGDLAAWEALVDRYSRLVYSVPVRLGMSADDAADVVQDTFSTLLVRLGDIDRPESLGSWLMTVARRLTWRRRAAERPVVEVAETMLIDSGSDERTLRAIALQGALETVGEPCSTLIRLLFLDPTEPGYTEVARCLGCAVGNVGPLRGRCLERLRRALGREAW